MIFTNSYRWSNTHFFLRFQRLFHCSGRTSGKPNAAQPMTVADKCPKWRWRQWRAMRHWHLGPLFGGLSFP